MGENWGCEDEICTAFLGGGARPWLSRAERRRRASLAESWATDNESNKTCLLRKLKAETQGIATTARSHSLRWKRTCEIAASDNMGLNKIIYIYMCVCVCVCVFLVSSAAPDTSLMVLLAFDRLYFHLSRSRS